MLDALVIRTEDARQQFSIKADLRIYLNLEWKTKLFYEWGQIEQLTKKKWNKMSSFEMKLEPWKI